MTVTRDAGGAKAVMVGLIVGSFVRFNGRGVEGVYKFVAVMFTLLAVLVGSAFTGLGLITINLCSYRHCFLSRCRLPISRPGASQGCVDTEERYRLKWLINHCSITLGR